MSALSIIRLHKRVIWGLISPCSAQYYAVWSLWILTLNFLRYSFGVLWTCDFWIPGYLSLTMAVLNPNLPFAQIIWTQAHTEGWALGNPCGLAEGKDGDFGYIPAKWGQAAKPRWPKLISCLVQCEVWRQLIHGHPSTRDWELEGMVWEPSLLWTPQTRLSQSVLAQLLNLSFSHSKGTNNPYFFRENSED